MHEAAKSIAWLSHNRHACFMPLSRRFGLRAVQVAFLSPHKSVALLPLQSGMIDPLTVHAFPQITAPSAILLLMRMRWICDFPARVVSNALNATTLVFASCTSALFRDSLSCFCTYPEHCHRVATVPTLSSQKPCRLQARTILSLSAPISHSPSKRV